MAFPSDAGAALPSVGAEVADAVQLAALRSENAWLRSELARLRSAHSLTTTSSQPTASTVQPLRQREFLILLAVLTGMAFFCALPALSPFKRFCETRYHKVYPIVTIINLVVLMVTMNQLLTFSFNDLFFIGVTILEVLLSAAEQLLTATAALVVLAALWKFKDRLLEALGIENAAQLLGDFRDWATCWSMWRFRPIELFIWKVEGLPAAKLHTPNDVFCEVGLGYNMEMRTRVHPRAGHSCTVKESVQLNFDPFDSDNRLRLSVKNQDVIGSTEIASVHFGPGQVRKLEGPPVDDGGTRIATSSMGRGGAAVWNPTRFHCVELVPAGRIYISFAPVPTLEQENFGLCWIFTCCCPKRATFSDGLLPS